MSSQKQLSQLFGKKLAKRDLVKEEDASKSFDIVDVQLGGPKMLETGEPIMGENNDFEIWEPPAKEAELQKTATGGAELQNGEVKMEIVISVPADYHHDCQLWDHQTPEIRASALRIAEKYLAALESEHTEAINCSDETCSSQNMLDETQFECSDIYT